MITFLEKILANIANFVIIVFVIAYAVHLQFTHSAGIAQSVEHFTRNEGVVGSSPISSFYKSVM